MGASLVKPIQKYFMYILGVAGSEYRSPSPQRPYILVVEGSGREWKMDRKTVTQGGDEYVVIFNKAVRER